MLLRDGLKTPLALTCPGPNPYKRAHFPARLPAGARGGGLTAYQAQAPKGSSSKGSSSKAPAPGRARGEPPVGERVGEPVGGLSESRPEAIDRQTAGLIDWRTDR